MTRTVTKHLATMEDLVAGRGQVSQTRGGTPLVLGKIDQAYAVLIEDDLKALDVTVFTHAFFNNTYYRYKEGDITGILPTIGTGSWLVDDVSNNVRATATSTQLLDVAADVNTTSKDLGKMVYNSTTQRPVWSTGALAADVWKYADGTTLV